MKDIEVEMRLTNDTTPRRGSALALLALAPLLALVTPHDGAVDALVEGLTRSSAPDPTAPLVALVGLAAWACTGWLLVVALLTWGSRLPGAVGRVAGRAVRWVAPRSVRSLVRAAVGTTLAASLVAGSAGSAFAQDRSPTIAGSSTDALDWPGLALAPPAAPAVHPSSTTPTQRPVTPTLKPISVPAPTRPVGTQHVTVHEGDSLWSLAAAQLGPAATQAQIAHAWPQWWAANRSVLGDHPGLIHPGTQLAVPDPS